MNTYEQKQAIRKARLQERADKKRKEAESLLNQAHQMSDAIPFGQPILVGHHSEKRDRNYRERMRNNFGKGYDLLQYAKELEARAQIESSAISSDDPDAVIKLQDKLEALEDLQQLMKDANAALRKGDDNALRELGFDDAGIARLKKPDVMGCTGYPTYRLSNNNANIRRVKDRIAELQRPKVELDRQHGDIRLYTDTEDNRICFVFPGKPDEATRTMLKQYGFKWSPSRPGKPWVRMNNGNGRAMADLIWQKLTVA